MPPADGPQSLPAPSKLPKGWIGSGIFGATLALGVFVHRILGHAWWIALSVIAIELLVIAVFVARALLHPNWLKPSKPEVGLNRVIIGGAAKVWGKTITNPLHDFQLPFHDISMDGKERDGSAYTLRGWYVPAPVTSPKSAGSFAPPSSVIVCVHGAGRDRRAFLRHTPKLNAAGYSVVLFDCREHGTSSHDRKRGIGYATREAEDVAVVTKHVRSVLQYKTVIVLGTSQGAASAIVSVARYDRSVDVLIAENPFSSREELMRHIITAIFGTPKPAVRRLIGPLQDRFISLAVWIATRLMLGVKTVNSVTGELNHPNPRDVMSEITCPVLLMHGTADLLIPYTHSQLLSGKATSAAVNELWLADGAEHTGLENSHGDEFYRRVIGFITNNLSRSALPVTVEK